MPAATLTSKGQLTLPRQVRELLKVGTGDAVDFIIGADGEIRLRAGHVDVRDLQGLLHKPGRRPVTLDEMDDAIERGRGSRP
jgi:AbrB family looped-hinge helix DNA binding protein